MLYIVLQMILISTPRPLWKEASMTVLSLLHQWKVQLLEWLVTIGRWSFRYWFSVSILFHISVSDITVKEQLEVLPVIKILDASGFHWVNVWTFNKSWWMRKKVLVTILSSSSVWYFPLFFFFLYLFCAWKPLLARYNSTFREMFIVNLLHLFHSDIDITGTDHSEVNSNSDSSSNSMG